MTKTEGVKKYKVTLNLSDNHFLLIGKISAQWSAVEWWLLRIMEALTDVDPKEARILGMGMNAVERIKVVRLLAIWRLKDGEEKDRLFRVLNSVDEARIARNDVAHGIWATDADDTLNIMKHKGGNNDIKRIRGDAVPMSDADLTLIAGKVRAAYDDLATWLKRYRSGLVP